MNRNTIMSKQANPDGMEGHIERDIIRNSISKIKPSHFILNHNRKVIIDPFILPSTVMIDDIKDCPSYVKGCNLHGCIPCKKRVWPLYSKIKGKKE